MNKRFLSIALSLVMCMSLCIPAFAVEEDSLPTPIEASDDLEPAVIENAGALTQAEIQRRLFHPVLTGYSRTTSGSSVTSTYNGTIDRGEVESGYNDKTTTDTMPFSIDRTVSNAFNLGLKLTPKADIEATVGYSVSWSETRSFGYNATVSPHYTVHIEYADCYHVSKLHTWKITEVWLGNSTTPSTTRKDDYSAWTGQWYKPHFTCWEEYGNHAV